MAKYGWIIDKDHLAEPDAESGHWDTNAAGVMGPRDAPDWILEQLREGRGRLFRIYDDDGELYYSGRILVDQPPGWDLQEECFGPLWDFGAPNAGATEIHYRHGKRWVQL